MSDRGLKGFGLAVAFLLVTAPLILPQACQAQFANTSYVRQQAPNGQRGGWRHYRSATSRASQPAVLIAKGQGFRNGLPPTRMDSFVREAKGHAAHIYGDEGVYSIPPYMGFSKVHRINIGIMDERDQGLTTGHGSYLPDAWGRDEFLGQEWSQSGATGHSEADGFSAGLPVTYAETGPGGPGQSSNLPPPPAEGYQPMYQHGVFVGWWSPEEIKLAQHDFKAALRSIVNSDRYYGGESGRRSILYEIGDIPSPF